MQASLRAGAERPTPTSADGANVPGYACAHDNWVPALGRSEAPGRSEDCGRGPHGDQGMSHFPDFDQLEQVLLHWPDLFDSPPHGTQPMAVQGNTVIVLCADGDWMSYVAANEQALVDGLRQRIAGELRLRLARIRPVPATPTEIFLARQLVVVQSKLRDLELGF